MTGRAELERLGWSERFAAHFAPHATAGRTPARVAVEHRSVYELLTEQGEAEASVGGRMRHAAGSRSDLPAVGDWVAFSPSSGDGPGIIDAVLPRSSLFTRKAAGREHGDQTIAANVDVVFIVTSLNAELNLRRLERYLALAWESGAAPVVVLSKADRMVDTAPIVREVEAVAVGAQVHVTSAKTGLGVDALRAHLLPHRTGALLGSSGVGKSTLINALVGFERQATGEIREGDDKGRHTTARRELVLLPGGGILIDTPGMRELQLSGAGPGLLSAFDDVESLGEHCAFRDCAHGPEPGCAVKAALAEGRIAADRLESYHKLVRELAARARGEHQGPATADRKERSAGRALHKHVKKKRDG
ncbi:MAG: ribosome small subunit-dependent GTPase A [Gemmatimonadales bacterium]|nr:ribosome small subunit-dependent GTPase A [Gemmatimonadales bacterium]